MKAVQRLAPHCTIDSELSEALLPKQERSYTQLWLQSLTSTPQRNTLQALEPGQLLQDGRYRVERRLGIGGQATAYLCRDEGSKQSVVLKETIIPVFADRSVKEQAILRFEAEGKLLQSLTHDHIVKLNDFFYEDHRCFLVLEHIDGQNLRQLVGAKGPLPEQQVRELAREMCKILIYLHQQNVVHRDFTPDNLILSNAGSITLIDFNIAQQAQGHTTGTIAGKHAYLPPEQFRGKANAQSDIYAFGATLYYLLVGTDRADHQSSPRQQGYAISEELDALIKRCTAIDCTHRESDVRKILAELGGNPDDVAAVAEEIESDSDNEGGSIVTDNTDQTISVGEGDKQPIERGRSRQ